MKGLNLSWNKQGTPKIAPISKFLSTYALPGGTNEQQDKKESKEEKKPENPAKEPCEFITSKLDVS